MGPCSAVPTLQDCNVPVLTHAAPPVASSCLSVRPRAARWRAPTEGGIVTREIASMEPNHPESGEQPRAARPDSQRKRPWVSPGLTELPRLTDLTLQTVF